MSEEVVRFFTWLSYLSLLKELSSAALLNICLTIISSILTSQLTSNHTLLNLLFSLFTIISLKPRVSKNYSSYSSWFISCLWYHWSFYPSWTSLLLVWNQFYGSSLVEILPVRSLFLCSSSSSRHLTSVLFVHVRDCTGQTVSPFRVIEARGLLLAGCPSCRQTKHIVYARIMDRLRVCRQSACLVFSYFGCWLRQTRTALGSRRSHTQYLITV
jgi:hypothetical protein